MTIASEISNLIHSAYTGGIDRVRDFETVRRIVGAGAVKVEPCKYGTIFAYEDESELFHYDLGKSLHAGMVSPL